MAHVTRSTSSIFSVNGDASATARLIDIHGAMSRVDVGNGRCTVVTNHGDRWTEATVDAQSVSGIIEFRTAQSQPDGSVTARAESWAGDLVKLSDVHIAANGEWKSRTEHHHLDGLLARTEASGALAAPSDGVSLKRLRFDEHGTQLWTGTATVIHDQYARYPGDSGDDYFKPDPDSSGGDRPSGDDEHPDHPDDGQGTQSAEYGDGDMGSDTGGGTPGLGWDGGGEGPLGLLPDHGAGVLGGGVEGIDTTGQDTVSGLIGQAIKHVVAQGGTGGSNPSDSGFGNDVTGSAGVVIAGTGVGHIGIASTDGEWGDFTDPKATLDFAQEVVTAIAHSGHRTAIRTAGVVSAVGSVGSRVVRLRTRFGR